VHALRDRGLLEIDHGTCRFVPDAASQSVQIPNRVEVVVTSRIDQLTIAEQLTVKVASLLGRPSISMPCRRRIPSTLMLQPRESP